MAEFHPVSPPVYLFDAGGECRTVFGWFQYLDAAGLKSETLVPAVANPDGPGIGPWTTYFGDDPWTMT
jgi:hypothetical protein